MRRLDRYLAQLLRIKFSGLCAGLALAAGAFLVQPADLRAEEGQELVPYNDPLQRQRPGEDPKDTRFPEFIYESVPDINSSASEFANIENRWNQLYVGKWYDPYNQNILKGDLPVFGDQAHPWFFEITAISDSGVNFKKVPLPVGVVSTNHPGSNNTFGDYKLGAFVQNMIFSFSLYNGNTTFKPQEFEFRVTPHFQYNYVNANEDGVLQIDPGKGDERDDHFLGFDELFAEVHLANISERFDFVSSRIGIQKFTSDFRGFILNDEMPGVRLFGNYENNKWQYNLAWFNRLDKDTNSGLNNFDLRHEQVLVANLYRQDALALGHTMQASIVHRIDNAGDEGDEYDHNGFLIRPAAIGDERNKNLQTTYLGIAGDGHFDRINTTFAGYYAFGSESHNNIAERGVDVSAGMVAAEVSYDIDWIRLRASALWASGDRDPFDSKANGFDAIFDNPSFAGGDLSYWQGEGIPLIGGGGVNLVNPASFLPDLRAGKGKGQSNFVNPGLRLYNAGVDFEVTPRLKWINNFTFLQFDNESSLRAVRQDASIGKNIGFDLSSGLLYRPFLNNNVQIRVGSAILLPGSGTEDLFEHDRLYHVFSNLTFLY